MNAKFKDLGTAFIRTSLVPPVGGFVLLKLAEWGIDLKEKSQHVYLATYVILSGLYYVVVHGVEVLSRNPSVRRWAGIFLGSPKKLTYTDVPKPVKEDEGQGNIIHLLFVVIVALICLIIIFKLLDRV